MQTSSDGLRRDAPCNYSQATRWSATSESKLTARSLSTPSKSRPTRGPHTSARPEQPAACTLLDSVGEPACGASRGEQEEPGELLAKHVRHRPLPARSLHLAHLTPASPAAAAIFAKIRALSSSTSTLRTGCAGHLPDQTPRAAGHDRHRHRASGLALRAGYKHRRR